MSDFATIYEYFQKEANHIPDKDERYNAFADQLELFHLDALKAAGEPRYINVRARSPRNVWKSLTIEVTRENFDERITDLWMTLNRNHAGWSWYACIGLQRTPPATDNGSGSKKSSDAPWVAVFDIDIDNSGGGHKLDQLGDEDDALDAIEFMEDRLGQVFDAIWFSGGGIQGAVRLTEPLHPDAGEPWEQVTDAYLQKYGIRMDRMETHGAQVVRLVGSVNAKYDHKPAVRWLSRPRKATLTSSQFGERVQSMLDDLGWTSEAPVEPMTTEAGSQPVAVGSNSTKSKASGTKAGAKGYRPGDRLNQVVTPFEALSALADIKPSAVSGRYEIRTADGTMTNGGGIAVFPDGGVLFHSTKAAAALGLRSKFGTSEAFALITEMYGSGSEFTIADAIRHVENQKRPTSDALHLLKQHTSEVSLRAAIGNSRRRPTAKSRF